MAEETSGRHSNALRLVSSTVVSSFAFTRSVSLGLNFPRYTWNELGINMWSLLKTIGFKHKTKLSLSYLQWVSISLTDKVLLNWDKFSLGYLNSLAVHRDTCGISNYFIPEGMFTRLGLVRYHVMVEKHG
jgi:hypothetical protein